MFKALFGAAGQSAQFEFVDQLEGYLRTIFNPETTSSEQRGAAYSLRDLVTADDQKLSRVFALSIVRNLTQFESVLKNGQSEEVAQTLLEILTNSTETAADDLIAKKELIELLLNVAKESPHVWVRLCSIQVLGGLASASPRKFVDLLLSIPSALELLVDCVGDPERDIRNEMLVLLLKLTEVDEQVRMFMMFCDAPNALLQLASEERETLVSGDCLAVCLNSLKDNPVGQKQFLETQQFLTTIANLLVFDVNVQDPSPEILRIARCVELIKVLCEGRAEGHLPVVACLNTSATKPRRNAFLLDAQKKLGNTPNLMENLFQVAKEGSSFFEDQTRRQAMAALGDLVCRDTKNGKKLEKLAGFTLIATMAITSSRWPDAGYAAYAWMSALEGTEGEQLSLVLLGHAVASLPEDILGEDGPIVDNAAALVADTLVKSLRSIISLREEIYVDANRVNERRMTGWRAMQLWERLLVSSGTKEVAARILVDGENLLDSICASLKELITVKDDTDIVRALVRDTCRGLLRLIVIWVENEKSIAERLLKNASNLFFFEPMTLDPTIRSLGALVASALLSATFQSAQDENIVLGLIKNQMGVDLFIQFLTMLKDQARIERDANNKENYWNDDSCIGFVLDENFKKRIDALVDRANSLLVKGSSISRPSGANQASAKYDAQPTYSTDSHSNGNPSAMHPSSINETTDNMNGDAHARLVKLERDYAELLIVLAHQELERQSLLQTIEQLGGKDAVDTALRRSAELLAKAFDDLKQ